MQIICSLHTGPCNYSVNLLARPKGRFAGSLPTVLLGCTAPLCQDGVGPLGGIAWVTPVCPELLTSKPCPILRPSASEGSRPCLPAAPITPGKALLKGTPGFLLLSPVASAPSSTPRDWPSPSPVLTPSLDCPSPALLVLTPGSGEPFPDMGAVGLGPS